MLTGDHGRFFAGRSSIDQRIGDRRQMGRGERESGPRVSESEDGWIRGVRGVVETCTLSQMNLIELSLKSNSVRVARSVSQVTKCDRKLTHGTADVLFGCPSAKSVTPHLETMYLRKGIPKFGQRYNRRHELLPWRTCRQRPPYAFQYD